jgi:hypothetical protein
MATKKKVVQSITKREPDALASIEAIEKGSIRLWQAFASQLSNLTPEQYPHALQFIKVTEKLTEDAAKLLKPMVIELVKGQGNKATDLGTMRLNVGGFTLEIQPNSTGKLEEKKVEALLRAKGLDVETHMDAVVTYEVNESKLNAAMKAGRLSKDELDTCRKGESWKLMSPKKES